MTSDRLQTILANHKRWLDSSGTEGQRANLHGEVLEEADLQGANLSDAYLHCAYLRDANLQGANLRNANLSDANLHGANLQGANLRNANLSDANLHGAYLRDANLQRANLRDANLQNANLQNANLQSANLQGANLRGANIDYASWPLWCGSLTPKIDRRIAAQLMYHALRAMQSCAGDAFVANVLRSEPCVRLANKFHRVDEYVSIIPLQKKGGAL